MPETLADSTPDPNWIRATLERYERPLVLYATRLTGDSEQAQDVVQETFLRLCRLDETQRAGIEERLSASARAALGEPAAPGVEVLAVRWIDVAARVVEAGRRVAVRRDHQVALGGRHVSSSPMPPSTSGVGWIM